MGAVHGNSIQVMVQSVDNDVVNINRELTKVPVVQFKSGPNLHTIQSRGNTSAGTVYPINPHIDDRGTVSDAAIDIFIPNARHHYVKMTLTNINPVITFKKLFVGLSSTFTIHLINGVALTSLTFSPALIDAPVLNLGNTESNIFTIVAHRTATVEEYRVIGGGSGGTIPNGTIENEHLEWDQTAGNWFAVANSTYGATGPFATGAFLNFANDVIWAAGRTGADDGNMELKFTTQDEFDFTNSNNSTVALLLRSQHASQPDQLFKIQVTSGTGALAGLIAPNNLTFTSNLTTVNMLLTATDIQVTTPILPDIDGTKTIGSTTVRFLSMHAAQFGIDTTNRILLVVASGLSFDATTSHTFDVGGLQKFQITSGLIQIVGNAEITNNLDMGGFIDMMGNDIILDADGDSRFELGTDDELGIFLGGGSVRYTFTINEMNLNGLRIHTNTGTVATAGTIRASNNEILLGWDLVGAGNATLAVDSGDGFDFRLNGSQVLDMAAGVTTFFTTTFQANADIVNLGIANDQINILGNMAMAGNIDMNTNNIRFDATTVPSDPPATELLLFSDSTNSDHLSIRRIGSTVDLEGGGGAGNRIEQGNSFAEILDAGAGTFDIVLDSASALDYRFTNGELEMKGNDITELDDIFFNAGGWSIRTTSTNMTINNTITNMTWNLQENGINIMSFNVGNDFTFNTPVGGDVIFQTGGTTRLIMVDVGDMTFTTGNTRDIIFREGSTVYMTLDGSQDRLDINPPTDITLRIAGTTKILINAGDITVSDQILMGANDVDFGSGGFIDFADNTGSAGASGGFVDIKVNGVFKKLEYFAV